MQTSLHTNSYLSKTHSHIKLPQSSPFSRAYSSKQRQNPIQQSTMETILHQSLIVKNKKLSMMIREVHGYMINVQELDWILKELKVVMDKYIRTVGDKGGVSHRMQVDGLYREMLGLLKRFSGVDQQWIQDMTVPMKGYHKHQKISNENINLMNLKKTETVGSFKCTDTENQQQITTQTDFSKIHLPQIVPVRDEASIKQFQAAIQMLKSQLEDEKHKKQKISTHYQDKIQSFTKKLQLCNNQWQTYKSYANCCIQKCRKNLSALTNQCSQTEKIQSILDQLFSLQSKLTRRILQASADQIGVLKQQKIRQLADIESQVKDKREQLDKIQTHRMNTNLSKPTKNVTQTELMKLLFVQATTIQHLI